VRAAFTPHQGPVFDQASTREVTVSRGRRGTGRGQQRQRNDSSFIFDVILLDPGQQTIPRGGARSKLMSMGRARSLSTPKGAPPSVTSRNVEGLFPNLRRSVNDYIVAKCLHTLSSKCLLKCP